MVPSACQPTCRPARVLAQLGLVASLLPLLGGMGAARGDQCHIDELTSAPVERSAGFVLVHAGLNGRDAALLLDTGADRMVVDQAAAERLGLRADPDRRLRLDPTIGDPFEASLAAVAAFTLGQARLPAPLVVVARLPVIARIQGRVDGILGADVLTRYDVDLDLPDGRMSLYQVHGCAGRFIPWTGPYQAVGFSWADDLRRAVIQVQLGTDWVDAVIDTGTSVTFVSSAFARWCGCLRQPAPAGSGPAPSLAGPDGVPRASELRRITTLRIGATVLRDVDLPVLDAGTARMMFLGLDYLLRHRVWISASTAQVFIAPAADAPADPAAAARPSPATGPREERVP